MSGEGDSPLLGFSGLVKKITGNGLVNRDTQRGSAGNGREKQGEREKKHTAAKNSKDKI